jgi:rRNA-processing protein FCF1
MAYIIKFVIDIFDNLRLDLSQCHRRIFVTQTVEKRSRKLKKKKKKKKKRPVGCIK